MNMLHALARLYSNFYVEKYGLERDHATFLEAVHVLKMCKPSFSVCGIGTYALNALGAFVHHVSVICGVSDLEAGRVERNLDKSPRYLVADFWMFGNTRVLIDQWTVQEIPDGLFVSYLERLLGTQLSQESEVYVLMRCSSQNIVTDGT